MGGHRATHCTRGHPDIRTEGHPDLGSSSDLTTPALYKHPAHLPSN